MVQIDIPTEEMKSSLVLMESQQQSVEDMEMVVERRIVASSADMSENTCKECDKASNEYFRKMFVEDTEMVQRNKNLKSEMAMASQITISSMEDRPPKRSSAKFSDDMKMNEDRYENVESDELSSDMFVEDMEKVQRLQNLASEIQASGLTERVQAHGNNKNLKLLKDVYLSMKGDVSAYRNFPAPDWRERGLHENDLFEQESPLGNTVLHIAARYGNDDWVDEVAQKAPHLLTAKNSNGDTALHVAAKAGHISILKRLLAAHLCNLSHPYSEKPKEALYEILVENKQGNTFLHEALFNSQKGIMNFLVSDEAQFEAGFKELIERAALFWTNKEKKSVLYLAIEAGYKEVVDQALAKLINLDPALHKLIENHQELAKLIPHGPHYVPVGKSPLLAAILKRDQDILHIILTKRPEWIHLRDTEGRTPLHYAASIGYLEVVQYLLGKCASCTIERDKYGFFPLHLASYGGHVEVVQKLLQYCLDPREILDNTGRNILHLAVESGKFNMVRYILQAADHELEKMINDKDGNGNTPLHLATLGCHPKIVHALTWDKRVDLTLVNGKYQTALDACEQFPLENRSLRQWLTWTALKSAGVQSADPLPIKVPPQSSESFWKQKTPNMNQYNVRINTLALVSTLVITVTFAAGFTMPGGTNSSDPRQGMALMLNRMWFKLFIFCITTSMYGAISVTIILIWAQLGDTHVAILALEVARPLFGVILATLSLAFLAGVHLVISDLSWLATTSLVIGVIFILMLLLLYFLLWFPSSSSKPFVRYISYYPFLLLASRVERDETHGNHKGYFSTLNA